MIVKRYIDIPEGIELKFAVILAKHNGKWIFCRHKNRDTFEFPGGHHESGETIEETAKRELKEETGAEDFIIRPLFVYSVEAEGEINYGMTFYADVKTFSSLKYEIKEIIFRETLPEKMTYPVIQLKLLEYYENLK